MASKSDVRTAAAEKDSESGIIYLEASQSSRFQSFSMAVYVGEARISSCSFLAHSSLWSCIPRLRRYREIHPDQRQEPKAAMSCSGMWTGVALFGARPIFAAELGRRSLAGREIARSTL